MANPNLEAAALQAGITGKKKEQVDGLSKLLDSHKSLLSLPQTQAKAAFEAKPADQQSAHAALFGGGKSPVGWLGDAAHYMGEKVKQTIALPFQALNEVSDFMTRVYRTGAIAVDQGVDLGKAFAIANDKGDKVFSPGRIQNANKIYGKDMMSVAMKVASGMSLSEVIATGSEVEKQIAAAGQSKKDKDFLLNDAIAAANAAKYSPGRQLANLVLPGNLEGKGALYKGISGIGDAGYRIFADPTLILGKAKKAYDAGDFLLFNILGKEKFSYGRNLMATAGNPAQVDRVFSNPGVTSLFDQYGAALGKLAEARAKNDPNAGAEAFIQAKRLIPEFGDEGIKTLMDAGVRDAASAKNYLYNHSDVKSILTGQAARKTALVPKMTPGRAARVAIVTTSNKVFNIDKAGQAIVRAIYGAEGPEMDIVGGLTNKSQDIAALEANVGRTAGKLRDGSKRFSDNQVSGRIDRFMRKFTTVPFFENGFFDVMGPGAEDKIYQLAALANTRWHSRVIREAFAAGDEGQRRQIFTGLWDTISEIRQVTRTAEGKNFVDNFSGRGLDYRYGADVVLEKLGVDGKPLIDELGNKVYEVRNYADFDGQQLALHGYQLSTSMAVPSIIDLDRLSAHSGIINRVLGISHKKWAERLTSNWVVGTLAGPKFPVRNAGEDIMIHLAVGDSPWGIVKGRLLSTQLRKFKEAETNLTREQRNLGQEIADLKAMVAEAPDAAKAEDLAKTLKTKQDQLRKIEGNKTRFYESRLGFVNRLVGRNQVKEFQIRIAEAGDNVEEVRKIMVEAMLRNKLTSRALSDTDKKYIAEFAKHGRTQEILDGVSEGSKNTLRGGDYSIQASNDTKQYGKLRALEYDGKAYKQSGSSFADFNPVATDQARLGWLVKIALHTNDEVDSVLLKHLNDKDRAINDLLQYIDENPGLAERFQSISGGLATRYEHAERAYLDVLNTFSKKNGQLNEDLWRKIRNEGPDGEIRLSSRNLSVDDLPKKTDADLHPASISGPTLVPVGDSDNITASIVSQLWDYMGEANSRFSREGIVFDAMLDIRRQMDETGMAQRIYKELTVGKEGAALEKAHNYAMSHITSIAEDMAKNRVLAYVDNPEVRSQLAMSVRNFARFYRATEDFYRRVYRTVKYNPEALTRASLTYEGVAHSGFVHTDSNTGEQYFVYPGLTPVYKVMNKVMKAFGVGEAFKAPMPVEFSGNIKMLTPSLNPDSLFPTFAGPLAAVPIKVIGNLIPQTKDLEQYLSGAYAQDQPLISAILPAHVNRLYQALNTDERNSQAASAARKAATYLEATGHGLEIKIDPETGEEIAPSPGELAAYQDKLQASTFTVLGLRFLFGFVAPASPSVTLKSDMAAWVKDNGEVSYKAVFNNLRTKYGDVDKAAEEWIRLFPDQMPYTISESQATTVASVNAVGKAAEWIDQNQSILNKYKEAGAFLIPNVGTFDFNAYKLLFKSGLKTNKTLTDFVSEISSAKDKQIYYQKKDEFDQQMSYTTSTDLKRQLRDQWQTWSDEFKGARPSLQEELSQGSAKAVQRTRALDDLRNMLKDSSVKVNPNLQNTLRDMLDTYDSYVSQRDLSTFAATGNTQDYKDMLRLNVQNSLQAIAGVDPNALAAYNSLFAPLFR